MEETAEVQVGNRVTAYRRAGRGEPVLLLCRAPDSCDGVFTAVARECRVVQPVLPPDAGPEDFHDWLHEVIEGLGLDRPILLADEATMALADAFVHARPGIAAAAVRFTGGRPHGSLRGIRSLAGE